MSLLAIIVDVALFAPDLLSQPAQDPCVGLPAGYCVGRNVLAIGLTNLAEAFVAFNAGAAILFVGWGGAQQIVAFGDEGKIQQGTWTIVFACLGFAFTLMIQTVLFFFMQRASAIAVTEPLNFAFLEGITNAMLYLFNITFVIVTILAGLWMVFSRGSQDMFTKARTSLYWSISGALFVNVAYAMVRAVYNIGL